MFMCGYSPASEISSKAIECDFALLPTGKAINNLVERFASHSSYLLHFRHKAHIYFYAQHHLLTEQIFGMNFLCVIFFALESRVVLQAITHGCQMDSVQTEEKINKY